MTLFLQINLFGTQLTNFGLHACSYARQPLRPNPISNKQTDKLWGKNGDAPDQLTEHDPAETGLGLSQNGYQV